MERAKESFSHLRCPYRVWAALRRLSEARIEAEEMGQIQLADKVDNRRHALTVLQPFPPSRHLRQAMIGDMRGIKQEMMQSNRRLIRMRMCP